MAGRGMSAGQKIITTLRERRQIEEDLREMPDSRSEIEFRRRAQQIASLGSQVIPAIVGSLDRADARLLAAMGAVATYSTMTISLALRQAVLQPGHTDQGRIGAMTILERFLGEEPDEELLGSLSDPEALAVSSLEEVLARAESNPAILAELCRGRITGAGHCPGGHPDTARRRRPAGGGAAAADSPGCARRDRRRGRTGVGWASPARGSSGIADVDPGRGRRSSSGG